MDLSPRLFRAAARFERTVLAVELAGAIDDRGGFGDIRWSLREVPTSASELIPVRAAITVGGFIPGEVLSRELPGSSAGVIDDGDMRQDLFLLHEPAEEVRGSVRRVGVEMLRLQIEAGLDAIDHRLCGVHFRAAVRRCRLDIQDDAGIHIGQDVV